MPEPIRMPDPRDLTPLLARVNDGCHGAKRLADAPIDDVKTATASELHARAQILATIAVADATVALVHAQAHQNELTQQLINTIGDAAGRPHQPLI
jgi:hypothetical protein